MEDSELKWEDQGRGGEDSRKGMAAEGTVPVVDGVTGARMERSAGHGGLGRTGVPPRICCINGVRSLCRGPVFLYLQVFRVCLGAEDMLSVYQAPAE